MDGMMSANADFIMICYVQVILDRIIKVDKNIMNVISKTKYVFSTKLNVTTGQLQKKLALAPLYSLFFFLGLFIIISIIQGEFGSSTFKEFLGIFLAYSIGILLVYFIITYIFIYALQLLLIKCNRLNLWFILGSAITLTLFFSSIIFLVTSLDLGIRGFNLGVVVFIGFFAISFAVMYWFLLLIQHRKNLAVYAQKT